MTALYPLASGICIGLLLLIQLKLWRDFRSVPSGRMLLCMLLGVSCEVVLPYVDGWPLIKHIIVLPPMTIAGFFWLFALALFQDEDGKQTATPLHYSVILLYVGLHYSGYWLGGNWGGCYTEYCRSLPTDTVAAWILWHLPHVVEISLILLALRAILQHRTNDLVEPRRRLRVTLGATAGAYIVLIIFAEPFLVTAQGLPAWLTLSRTLVEVLLLFATGAWLLIISPNDLIETFSATPAHGDTEPATVPASDDQNKLSKAESQQLKALIQSMETEAIYRTADLTIGSLAAHLRVPEHKLRRLINQRLGYRNFNDYLNRYRIAEAALRLVDSEQHPLPILTIALEVGYRSLTTFNKAFKTLQTMTPSEYRRQHLPRDVDGSAL